MHAAIIEAFGGPDVLRTGTVPDPVAGEGEVVVELTAAALNWHDCLVRSGHYPAVPLPHIIGSDGAGIRRDTGEPVVILPSLRWGPVEAAPGPDWSILGDDTKGTYAELVTVPAANVFRKPAGWSFAEGAALPLAGLTAYRALFSRGNLQTDETVLVLGASGGVASVTIALAAMAGARVLITTSSAEKLAAAKEHGASDGVLYTEEGWPEAIRELTGGAGVDLVIDSVGSTWEDALTTLRGGGRLVSFGATGAARTEVGVRRLYFGQWSILGTTMGSPHDFNGLLQLLDRHPEWRPHVDRTFALDDVAEAHRVMERREHTGKLVLEIR